MNIVKKILNPAPQLLQQSAMNKNGYESRISRLALIVLSMTLTLAPFIAQAGNGGTGGGDVIIIGNQAPVFADKFVDPHAIGTSVSTPEQTLPIDDPGEPISFSPDVQSQLTSLDAALSFFGAGHAQQS